MIPFNRPHLPGAGLGYIESVLRSRHVAGDGMFSRRCQTFFETRYGLARALLTTSCTDALEMSALLCEVGPGDEVILPSYTFVSTANAFVLRGASLVFVDSLPDHPNLDPSLVKALLTPRTKVIVAVHYAGVAVDMDPLLKLSTEQGVMLVEDAAQAVEATYHQRQLGTIGHLGAFSFHETKNIHCGEGGLLAVNHLPFAPRAEVLWDKGTNRSAFFRGQVDKYGWVDLGSSFLPSDILAALLWAQLEEVEQLTSQRLCLWNRYAEALLPLTAKGVARLPTIPVFSKHNGHAFYLVLDDEATRTALIAYLEAHGVQSAFHYQSLHRSAFWRDRHDGRRLPNADRFSDCLLRLPLYHDLVVDDQDQVIDLILSYFGLAGAMRPAAVAT